MSEPPDPPFNLGPFSNGEATPSHQPPPTKPAYPPLPPSSLASTTAPAGSSSSTSRPPPPTSASAAPSAASAASSRKRKVRAGSPSENVDNAGPSTSKKPPKARKTNAAGAKSVAGDTDELGGGSQAEEEGDEAKKRIRRNRVHFSCVECHRRKQKCDRNEPCGQCVARKVPHMCRPFINGFEDPGAYEGDLKSRLSRIEDLLESLIPRISPLLATNNTSGASPTPPGFESSTPPPGHTSHFATASSRSSLGLGSGNSRRRVVHRSSNGGAAGDAGEEEDELGGEEEYEIDDGEEGVSGGSGRKGKAPMRRSAGNGSSGRSRVRSNGAEAGWGTQNGQAGLDSSLSAFNPTRSPSSLPLHLTLPAHPSPTETASSPSLTNITALQHHGSSHSGGFMGSHHHGHHVPHTISGRPPITLDNPPPDLQTILDTLTESGITRKMLVGLLDSVPEKTLSDNLVELYFREIDWTRYKLHRPAFSRRYIQFFDLLAASPQNPALDADLIKWLPLYFAVLAIATLSATAEMVGGETGQKAWSRRFHGSSRIGLSCAKALQRDNLDVIYAGLLTARYMLLNRRAAEGSTPLTSAYQLGLYRDGLVLNLSDKKDIELRRRGWAMVYHLDRTTALLVGRPTSISDAHTDTREPANLDDLEVESGDFDPRGHPLTHPTEWTQVILRHRLAQIIGRISDHTFAIKPPDYTTVLRLDQELLNWQSKLPSFFAIHHPNTTLDHKYHFIFVQRHLLACEFLFARITLHRPYLLRKRDQDNQYAYSREAAIESAKADLIGRRSFMFEKPVDLKVNSGGYRVLNSYIVLGVAIKLDPASPRAEELRRLLDVVAGIAPDEHGRFSEPIVKDEMAIVDFLTQRAKTSNDGPILRSSAPIPPYSHLLPSHRNAPSMLSRRSDMSSTDTYSPTLPDQPRPPEDPAWSFVAPEMDSIDVHQPFGDTNIQPPQPVPLRQVRQVPPPLQAPVPRQRNPHNIPPWEQAGWGNPYATPAPHQRTLPVTAADMQQQQQQPQSQGQMHSIAQSTGSAESAAGPSMPGMMDPPPFPTPGPNNTMTPADWADWDNWWNSNQATLGTPMPANSSTTGQMGFNPFALSQFGQAESAAEDSSEAAFLNMLLSTIANTSAST